MSSRLPRRPNARVISSANHSHSHSGVDRRRTPSAALSEIRQAAAVCKACDLWKNATQTVLGEGKPGAVYMMVGEQPGDSEDRKGHPFIGPAGRVLANALAEAGIDREDVYVTNVVKHSNGLLRRGAKSASIKSREILNLRPAGHGSMRNSKL